MTNAEVQSYIDEIAPLPLRGNFEPYNNWSYGFLIPWYLVQVIAGDKAFIPEHIGPQKYIYPTLQNLLAFASHGVQLIKARLLGLWNYYEPGRFPITPGCRVREKDGTRKIALAYPNPNLSWHYFVPELLSPRRSGWKKCVYQFPEKTFTAQNNSVTVTSIEGKNQYFRIQGLPDDFLKIRRVDSQNKARGLVEYKNSSGGLWHSQYATLPTFASYTSSGAFGLQYETIEGHTYNVLSEDSCLPRDVRVSIYLTESGNTDVEIYSQTISYLGIIKDLYVTNISVGLTELVSGTSVFFTPQEYREMMLLYGREQYLLSKTKWYSGDNYTELRQVQAELRQKLSELDRCGIITQNMGSGWTGLVHENICSIGKNSSTVFLKSGHTYGLRVDVNNVYVPLSLSNISTLQSSLMYQPINATQI